MTTSIQYPLYVYKNPYALPISFIANKKIIGADVFKNSNTFEIYNSIAKEITGQDFGLIYSVNKVQNIEYIDSDKIAKMEITIPSSNKNYWLTQSDTNHLLYNGLTVNNKLIRKLGSIIIYTTEYIGNFNDNERLNIIAYGNIHYTIKPKPEFYYASENTELLKKYFNLIKENPAELKVISSSYLKGTFKINNDNEFLFMTIPYDKNWEIKVDGKKVEQLRVLYQFTGISAEQGTHTFEMRYKVKGLKSGLIISFLSFFLLIIFLINQRKREE